MAISSVPYAAGHPVIWEDIRQIVGDEEYTDVMIDAYSNKLLPAGRELLGMVEEETCNDGGSMDSPRFLFSGPL
jgi:hypothetical protein